MKSLIEKITSKVASVFVLLVGVVMAGLGVMTMALLGFFALAAFGLALLAAPFIAKPQADEKRDVEDAEFETVGEPAPAA